MAQHSKIVGEASAGFTQIIINALLGSNKKKAFSGVLLAIIGYLIYMKNKKSSTDFIKVAEKKGDKKVNGLSFRKAARAMSTLSSSRGLSL
jgi:hypothetical protein